MRNRHNHNQSLTIITQVGKTNIQLVADTKRTHGKPC